MSDLENEKIQNQKTGLGSDVSGYWQDVENKVLDKKFLSQEFADDEFDSFSVKKNRRSFLKIMGFSVSALPLTGCIKIPVRKALPYINKQDNTIPGVANWYASTFEGNPILVKTREGRPIKIEGNDKSTYFQGGVGSRGHGSVFTLYDSNRLKMPRVGTQEVEWEEFDKALSSKLNNGDITYVVTPTIDSPSQKRLLSEFSKKHNAKHIAYESISNSAVADANKEAFGSRCLNEYDFEAADVVVSFEADFLNNWGQAVVHAKGYSKRRDANHSNGMNRHFQVESLMSMTGSNADYRYTKSHADQKDILLGLHSAITGSSHATKSENKDIVKKLAGDLLGAKSRSIVVSGINEIDVQLVVNSLNVALENYSKTINLGNESHKVLADDSAFETFVKEMKAGKVKTAMFVGVNPAYDYYDHDGFQAAVKNVKNVVTFTLAENETSSVSNFVAPINHVFESWSDHVTTRDEVSITQPVIQPLFGTRMWSETLLSLMGIEMSFYEYVKTYWTSFGVNWNQLLHDGVTRSASVVNQTNARNFDVSSALKVLKKYKAGSGMNFVTYTKAVGNGDMANNPWIQELPDPITKATWDNYAMVSPLYAKEKGIKLGDVLELNIGTKKLQLPALVQPGTEKNTVAIALGYGRTVAGKVAKNLGTNVFGLVHFSGTFHYSHNYGTVTKTDKTHVIAQTQTHHSMEGRDIVRETTFGEFKVDAKAGHPKHSPKIVHIYPSHHKDGHQWAMSVNLSSCTGCSSCIISCSAENNVPVVGKQEVANRREMHWMRLDRYYKGDENQPEVVHQPMTCQHCENAPCENVCPVMATVHSSDGLNQQIYNRCVGTRYCANNCPYKVRRFNWFNYDRSDKIAKMALNPDIGVRTRGIMEKCSMCIQRIQDGKLTAKRERRALKDGDIKLACQQSCPSDAIVFGDMNDKSSKISEYLGDKRNYTVLEELNVQPRVSYLTKIRNK